MFSSDLTATALLLSVCVISLSATPRVSDATEWAAYEAAALTSAGDVDNGKRLFHQDERTKCSLCHVVEGQGGKIGPDLTHIGGKFDRPHLIESILLPSQQIVEGYRTSVVVTWDGEMFVGLVKSRTDEQLVLTLSEVQEKTIAVDDIDEEATGRLSLMPEGVASLLSTSEFTDLIAYLESLRSGEKPSFGSGTSGPVSLLDGFRIRTVATGLDGATALEALPDGRILLCEQTGSIAVLKDDRLLEEPLLTLPVEGYWERGIIGVTVDPDFPQTPFVYVCWVAKDPYPHHRISRFVMAGDKALPETETVLLVGDDQRTMGGNVPAGHQGGALHFGPDGKLYIGIGEQTAGQPSQELDTFLGKMLRINSDGTIPADNPFLSQTKGKYQAIWARGCRNPFTFAFRSSDGLLLINDVGGKHEEINIGRAGANYGWPTIDHGPTHQDGVVGPIHWYPEASICGGDFVPAENAWPESLRDKYLFADFVHGWIHVIDPKNGEQSSPFADGLRRPVDLRFAADGELYVLLRNAWVIDGKFEGGTGSLMKIEYVGGEL